MRLFARFFVVFLIIFIFDMYASSQEKYNLAQQRDRSVSTGNVDDRQAIARHGNQKFYKQNMLGIFVSSIINETPYNVIVTDENTAQTLGRILPRHSLKSKCKDQLSYGHELVQRFTDDSQLGNLIFSFYDSSLQKKKDISCEISQLKDQQGVFRKLFGCVIRELGEPTEVSLQDFEICKSCQNRWSGKLKNCEDCYYIYNQWQQSQFAAITFVIKVKEEKIKLNYNMRLGPDNSFSL
ncbi:MAG: hypothetical protein Q8Q60_05040 [Candidatus Chromulinivorax sp.]|nr:hypothetical protein [Candidatus Chromulinivorax sp.]